MQQEADTTIESSAAKETRPGARPEKERRLHPRTSISTEITFTSDSNFYTGLTRDISQGGIFLATHIPVSRGSIIDLEFTLPDNGTPIRAQGEVRWIAEYNPTSDAPPGIGCRFLDLSKTDSERIERFVQQRDTIFFED